MIMTKAQEQGSATARGGFKNENDVIAIFNDWRHNSIARKWLRDMGYNLGDIDDVTTGKPKRRLVRGAKVRKSPLNGQKTDAQVSVIVKLKNKSFIECNNISIKLVSTDDDGFNQIDKRWVDDYVKTWHIPSGVETALRYFVGEIPPMSGIGARDLRRMHIDELPQSQQDAIVNFFQKNIILVIADIIKGNGPYAAEWILVSRKTAINSKITSINIALQKFYGDGKVEITAKGNLRIGNITMQRKGGDGGKKTAQMLQFKISPGILL